MSEYNEQIGRRIMEARKKKNMSRRDLLDYVDISETYLGMIERGQRGTSLEHLVQISDALEISLDYLISGVNKPELHYTARLVNALGSKEKRLIHNIALDFKANKRDNNEDWKTLARMLQRFIDYKTNYSE